VRNGCAVAIVGGGPAGLSTAIHLAREGVPTALIADSIGSVVPAAETLPPNTKRELRDLGMSESCLAQVGVPCYGIEAAWGRSTPTLHSNLVEPYGHGWHIDARLFRKALLALGQSAGVTVIRGRCVGVEEGARWRVNVQTDQGVQRIHCDFLVDATGRTASVARLLGARLRRLDSMVALVTVLEAASPAATLAVEAVSNGWWYCNPSPRQGTLTGFVTDADLARRSGAANASVWLDQLTRTTFVSQRVRRQQNVRRVLVTSCASALLDPLVGDRWLAVGDAIAVIDPLSSQGISKALASGKRAAQAIAAHLLGDSSRLSSYAARGRAEHQAYVSARTGNYLLERRWAAEAFWLRRQTSVEAPIPPSTRTMPTSIHYGA
jgi:flavin-dependent dehydrogenase